MILKLLLPRLIVGFGLSLALTAGAADAPAVTDTQQLLDQEAALHQQLVRAIGMPRATEVSLCRALPVGSKACGGPSSYLVYSVQVSDANQLQKLAQSIADIDSRLHQAQNTVSDCSMLLPPKLVLVHSVCQAEAADASQTAPK